MTVTRLAILTLLLWPAIALGQVKEDEQDKVSNDNPGRPLQMPPASTEVKEAIDDFERFQRRGAWERALKALYTIPDDQTLRFLDGENGFVVPVAHKRRSILSSLSPNGQAACRLFYDAEAKKLLDDAEGPTELKNLERLYSAYFTTSVGDNAADRLGDLYYELGRFERAADCWLAVLRERPDTDLSQAMLAVKAALALFRAGRKSEFEQVQAELKDRYGDERVTLGGQTAAPAELLRRLISDESTQTDLTRRDSASSSEPGPDLVGSVDPLWKLRFAESVEAGMTPPELQQWESNPLSAVVPAAAIDQSNLFVNYLGYIFALDLKTGKMLWRTAAFHHLEVPAMQDFARALDPGRFGVVAQGDLVWALARDLKEPNYFAPFQLTCYRSTSGEIVWQSKDLTDYAALDLVGQPLLADGKLFLAAKTQANPQMQRGLPQQLLLAIQPHDGKLLWKTEIGTFRQQQQFFFYYGARDPAPQPRLVYRAGAIYIETHVGVFARLDADSGTLDWGYAYRTEPFQGQSRFFFYYGQQSEPTATPSQPLQSGDGFLIKGMQSSRLYAIEPNRMKVLWERPISKYSRLLGASDRTVFLGGQEISALDLAKRNLMWATRLPSGSLAGHVLVRADGIWQLTPRGIFEIDPGTGDVRRIFRGSDLGAGEGDLFLTDRLLLAVSSRTITAYPRTGTKAEAAVRQASTNPSKGASK
jgi:outer membrane protein assembly factor BamB